MKLTDIACRTAKPLSKSYKKADGGGLYLLIRPNGAKYWRMKYRFLGKEKMLSFGTYPFASLLEAREQREKAKKILATGADPSQVKKDNKRNMALNAHNTFELVAREWHEKQKNGWSASYIRSGYRTCFRHFGSNGRVPLEVRSFE